MNAFTHIYLACDHSLEFRVTKDWTNYERLSGTDSASIVESHGSTEITAASLSHYDPLPGIHDLAVEIHQARSVLVGESHFPAPYPPNKRSGYAMEFQIISSFPLTRLIGQPVTARVACTFDSTSSFPDHDDYETIDIDVSRLLVGAVALGSIKWIRKPYVRKAIIVFSGLLANSVADYLYVRIGYKFVQNGSIATMYDGFDIGVTIDVRGTLLDMIAGPAQA